jgi:predicted dehydrogenase
MTPAFRSLDADGPLRLAVVGAGGMGRAWLETISRSSEAVLAGVADLDLAAAQAAAGAYGPSVLTGTDAVDVARRSGAHAVVDVTIPEAHHAVTTAALVAGLPVLGEKPVTPTVAEALSLAATAEVTGELFMVSQSRRWNPQLATLNAMVGRLGPIGSVGTVFARAAHFPGFREQMADPLLVDMAIHHFDAARYLLGSEPVAVYCEGSNPAWSWYAGDANAVAVFEMGGGTRFVYDGTWCSPGAETSWNAAWRVNGEHGTALWNGDDDPTLVGVTADHLDVPDVGLEIDGSLREFAAALRTGRTPSGEVHDNVLSLAMVEAAVQSSRTGRRILLDDILDTAYETALGNEQRPDVRARLASWPSVQAALGLA